MANTKTVHVPHLWGTDVGYQMPRTYDPSKPTCVLINSFSMTSDLYEAQFQNDALLDAMNLLAVEVLGHGKTCTSTDTFTYWDTAIVTLQALDALNIHGKVFALGTSQGGWIVVRMALLQPQRVAGLIPLGTSMDYESDRSRKLGNFDCPAALSGPIKALESPTPTPEFVIDEEVRKLSIYTGFGQNIAQQKLDFWHEELKRNYSGDAGRKRLKEISINLRDRDGLHARLYEVRCPVLWLHGTEDAAYSVANAEEEIKLFVNSPDAKLKVVEGGQHYLSASHPKEVDDALLEFVRKYS